MAFLAAGILALGAVGSGSWWWWSAEANVEVPTAPALGTVVVLAAPVTIVIPTTKGVVVPELNLIDELKVALEARRARRAPGID
jgi:hypothetical protein